MLSSFCKSRLVRNITFLLLYREVIQETVIPWQETVYRTWTLVLSCLLWLIAAQTQKNLVSNLQSVQSKQKQLPFLSDFRVLLDSIELACDYSEIGCFV